MTRLLCTPYRSYGDWKIAVTKFNGTFFLCEFETEYKKNEREEMTPLRDEMCYWGWKFEQYVTAGMLPYMFYMLFIYCGHISIYVCDILLIL